jgi:hypothetical protein
LTWPEGLTAWAIILTFAVIGWQADETRKAARAASQQADAMIASERAWVVVRSSMKEYIPSTDDNYEYWWSIENTGHTQAQIIETQCLYELVYASELYNLPPIPKYPEPIKLEGFLLAPGRIEEYKTGLRAANNGQWVKRGDLDTTDISVVLMEMYHLRAYGYVRYIDTFGTTRESRFCEYYVWPLPERPPRATGFRPLIGIPPEYTKCT